MDDPLYEGNIYAAPDAKLTVSSRNNSKLSIGKRFWLTSAICGLIFPVVLGLLLLIEPSAGSLVAAMFACWLLPLGWILLPELKLKHGFARLTFSRFAVLSICLLACAIGFSVVLLIVLSIGFQLFELVGAGT